MSVEVADLVFVRLADIQNEDVFLGVQAALEFFYGDFKRVGAHGFFLSSQSTEFFVIDQFSNTGVLSANYAIGIFTQLQFTKPHAQGVHQKQTSDQRFAFPDDELDGLSGLNQADESGQDAEHASL